MPNKTSQTLPKPRNAIKCVCCGESCSRKSSPDGLCGRCETGRCDSKRDATCLQCGAAYPSRHDPFNGGLCDACNAY
jgi:hypothetical protein